MKTRTDSLFAKLTEEQRENLLISSLDLSLDQMCKVVEIGPEPIRCSVSAMSRFLKKAKEEKLLRDAEESQESMEAFAKRGEDQKVREATLAAMRTRMFSAAIESNNREQIMEMYGALNNEKSKDRMIELEERKVKVAEENARLGWRKMEAENARAGLKALPRIRELLSDRARPAEERVEESLQLLMQVDAAVRLLLPEPQKEELFGRGPALEPIAIPVRVTTEVERAA